MKKLYFAFLAWMAINCFLLNYSKADTWSTCNSIGFCGANPSLPVFGSGPFTNIGDNRVANANAAIHIVVATAIPLVAGQLWGKDAKIKAGLAWIALTLVQEAFFHAPKDFNTAYPSEVRTDLITRIAPTLLVLSF